MQLDHEPLVWEDDCKSLLEMELEASIRNARRAPIPQFEPAAHRIPTPIRDQQNHPTASETIASSTLSGLISGCGIAAIDGYLAMKHYAADKGLDLAELHHKGIDLQDLVSTLVIHTQRMAEMEGRQGAAAQRWKR